MTDENAELSLTISVGSWSFSASGEKKTVLDTYADFKKFLTEGQAPPVPKDLQDRQKPPADNNGSSSDPEAKGDRTTTLPLKPYLDKLELKGNKEKATALIAWSGESGTKAALTVSEVEALWKKGPFKAPGNLARDIRKAESEGWLDSDGTAGSSDVTYSINGYGEGIVEGWAKGAEE
jgi:hypothetical protein